MKRASGFACVALVLAVVALPACSSDDDESKNNGATTTTAESNTTTTVALTPGPVTSAPGGVPGALERVVFSGDLTLDGAPFDAEFLGAVVRRDGLITPCQFSIPPVAQGRYSIPVMADTESAGCGVPGAEVFLWTFKNDKTIHTSDAARWPAGGRSQTFDANFSSATPAGALPPVSQFSGNALGADGRQLPGGTKVEAYVGETVCGVSSTRHTGDFLGYILSVVGPESITGCTSGATINFHVNGMPAAPTGVNTPTARGTELDLTIK